MNREDIRYIGLLFREIAGRERKIAVCTFLLAILEAANPYIMILCTGVLVDGVYRKESMESLLFYTACALGLKLLFPDGGMVQPEAGLYQTVGRGAAEQAESFYGL